MRQNTDLCGKAGKKALAGMLRKLRVEAPRIHMITNYVTANDCANLLLACGAKPIMADAPEEAKEITAQCGGLALNLGTPNRAKLEAMLLSGTEANALGRPVVLDPVGVGASAFRMESAQLLLQKLRFAVIRGNASEIRALAAGFGAASGVDAAWEDRLSEESLPEAVSFAKAFAETTGAVIVMSGEVDVVADSRTALCMRGGHRDMSRISGTGCQLTALTAAFAAANPTEPFLAAAAAVCAMELCGESAHERLAERDGNASYRNYIIDAVYHLTPEALEKGAEYEL